MTVLVTGGAGFIGSHVVESLVEMGERCVVVTRQPARCDFAFLKPEDVGRVTIEEGDVSSLASLTAIAEAHHIEGVVHLAAAPLSDDDVINSLQTNVDMFLNVLRVAREMSVSRVSVASAIGVYMGADLSGGLHEDSPLPLDSRHPIQASKKIAEIIAGLCAGALGVEIVNLRIGAIWGPRGRSTSSFFAIPQLIHAGVAGTSPDFASWRRPPAATDAIDALYARDCGRAIALVQTATHLTHSTYNIGSGVLVSNAEVLAALEKSIPSARIALPSDGETGGIPFPPLDISRLRQDVGFEVAYGIDDAVADYVRWLQDGQQATQTAPMGLLG